MTFNGASVHEASRVPKVGINAVSTFKVLCSKQVTTEKIIQNNVVLVCKFNEQQSYIGNKYN